MHDVCVRVACDEILRRLGFSAGVNRRDAKRLRFDDRLLELVERAGVTESTLLPQPSHHAQPLRRPPITGVVHIERKTELLRFIAPPRRDDVQRNAAAADRIDVRGRFREQSRMMEIRPDSDHQLQPLRNCGKRRRCRPGIETRRIDAFDIVEVQLRDQCDVEPDLLAAHGEIPNIAP